MQDTVMQAGNEKYPQVVKLPTNSYAGVQFSDGVKPASVLDGTGTPRGVERGKTIWDTKNKILAFLKDVIRKSIMKIVLAL
jgi:hypothetical protein